MSAASLATLARMQRQARRGFAHGSEIHEGEAFRIHLRPDNDAFYRNLALPVRRPAAWPVAIRAMIETFLAAGRQPRLELLEELWPDLPGALEAAGLVCEARAPVLAVERAEWDRPSIGDTVVVLAADSPTEGLVDYARQVAAAFGMTEIIDPEHEARQLSREIGEGRTLVAVRIKGGKPIAGASLIGLGREAELAGVWTFPNLRRQGHALAVCRALMARFFADGGELLWLSATDHASERLYRRLGFMRVGTQLNYALPAEDRAPAGATPAPRS